MAFMTKPPEKKEPPMGEAFEAERMQRRVSAAEEQISFLRKKIRELPVGSSHISEKDEKRLKSDVDDVEMEFEAWKERGKTGTATLSMFEDELQAIGKDFARITKFMEECGPIALQSLKSSLPRELNIEERDVLKWVHKAGRRIDKLTDMVARMQEGRFSEKRAAKIETDVAIITKEKEDMNRVYGDGFALDDG